MIKKLKNMAIISMVTLAMISGQAMISEQAMAQTKPRVLISTDLGGGDHDDAQSMIHALLYANSMNYRGFVITRSDDEGVVRGVPRSGVAMLEEMVTAYGNDLSKLRSHDSSYPSAAALKSLIVRGAFDSAWPGTLSAGASKIISEARASTAANPLYIITWGPIHDAAAALRAAPDIVSKVRLYSVAGYGQDVTHTQAFTWLENAVRNNSSYRNLWWINAETTIRGMYMTPGMTNGASQSSHIPWIETNVRNHGSLGNLYFNKYTYNTSWQRDANVSPDGLKMGDTPSLLYLLDNVNNDNPTASSWGGSFRKTTLGLRTWTDKTDASLRIANYDGARTVYQHRTAILNSFATRLDWARAAN